MSSNNAPANTIPAPCLLFGFFLPPAGVTPQAAIGDPDGKKMKSSLHIALLAVFLSVTGCSTLPRPLRDNEFGNYLSGQCAEGADKAISGDQSGFRTCFFAAYSRVRDPLRGGEDIQSIRLTLENLLQVVGDDVFAYHLANEPEPVRSGVKWFIQGVDLDDAPKTDNLIIQTQEYNFELIAARDGKPNNASPHTIPASSLLLGFVPRTAEIPPRTAIGDRGR